MKRSDTITQLAIALIGLTLIPFSAFANETVFVRQNFALKRVVKADVTPLGVVLDINSPIASVNLSDMRNIVFLGIDGALCAPGANCPDGRAPTKLLLRKIAPIKFENQSISPDGTSMLVVVTSSGKLYRFQLKPVNKSPDYTQIVIESESPASIPSQQ
jgi:hypothetical protein